eukprot:13640228-Alexandrium_andersonii.AAC.1
MSSDCHCLAPLLGAALASLTELLWRLCVCQCFAVHADHHSFALSAPIPLPSRWMSLAARRRPTSPSAFVTSRAMDLGRHRE